MQRSKARSEIMSKVHDAFGSGRDIEWKKDGRGSDRLVKGTAIFMAQLEAIMLPTHGKKKQLEALAAMGLSGKYPAYHTHITDVVSTPSCLSLAIIVCCCSIPHRIPL